MRHDCAFLDWSPGSFLRFGKGTASVVPWAFGFELRLHPLRFALPRATHLAWLTPPSQPAFSLLRPTGTRRTACFAADQSTPRHEMMPWRIDNPGNDADRAYVLARGHIP